jgi:HlyD family secretion protein
MDAAKLEGIRIEPSQRRRPRRPFWLIIGGVLLITALAAYLALPRQAADRRLFKAATGAEGKPQAVASTTPTLTENKQPEATDAVLTVSGYIVNRERIEISPRFMGQVKWIGVKKGDRVTAEQVLVRLDDAEQKARLLEIEGQLAGSKVELEKAKLAFERVKRLRASQNETAEREDEARLQVEAAKAHIQQMEGMREMARVQLDWTVIRSPISGVILEKLAEPGELVTPQSFGGTRGPSTALVALADPNDLQVEIDVNESDLPKVALNQKCRVTPEAFRDKHYAGYVAEVAPEANRQKGTLQIKVQVEKPDQFLTPELSARVDFLRGIVAP